MLSCGLSVVVQKKAKNTNCAQQMNKENMNTMSKMSDNAYNVWLYCQSSQLEKLQTAHINLLFSLLVDEDFMELLAHLRYVIIQKVFKFII